MIFPAPPHNLIFFHNRLDTLPPLQGRIRNFIQPWKGERKKKNKDKKTKKKEADKRKMEGKNKKADDLCKKEKVAKKT